MGALLAAEGEGGDRFSEDELVPVVAHFVFAGHETTTNLIGNALRGLLVDDRGQWDMLREEPSLVPAARSRNCSATTVPFRSQTEPPPSTTSSTASPSTNGTPSHWCSAPQTATPAIRPAQPNRSSPDPTARHVGFGLGPHFCLGAALTRLETSIVLEMLVRRYPDMSMAVPTPSPTDPTTGSAASSRYRSSSASPARETQGRTTQGRRPLTGIPG